MANPQIAIKVFVQPNWCKTHKELEITFPQESLDDLKQKILTDAKANSTNLDRFEFSLQYMGMDMPMVNEDDLYYMLGDLLQDPERLVIINIKKIVKRRAKKQFVFDEIGTANPTLDNEGDIVLNRPSDKVYNGSTEVICAFCRTSNKDKSAIRDLGPFYGPFKNKQKSLYVHELCAIWTPDVYLDPKTDKLKNLLKEVKRCNKMMCGYCGKHGGGLGCLHRTCRKSFHFKCALDDKLECQLDYGNHTLLCPEHAEKEDDIDVETVFCKVCDGGSDENLLILCDKCLRGYHIYCLSPPIASVPAGDWFCGRCTPHKKGNMEEEIDEIEEEDPNLIEEVSQTI